MGAFTTPETQENRVGLLNSLFKEIYADNLENLLPKGLKLQKDIAWIEKSKSPGAKYNQPVLMRHEHGFTYANNSSGAFALEDAVPGQTDTCNILGTQMMLRSIIDYEIAARASSAGKRTFRRALDLVVENMFASSRKRMEIDYFYGQRSLLESSDCSTVDGKSVITCSERSWAPGIWAGMEGAKLSAFANETSGVHAAVTSGSVAEDTHANVQTIPKIADAVINDTLEGVNVQDKKLTLAADGFTALISDADEDSRSGWVCFKGAMEDATTSKPTLTGNVFAGMESIMDPEIQARTETFNLDFTQNSLWQPNVVDVNAQLNFSHVANQLATASAKGLDENLILYLNPHVWTDLVLQEMTTGGDNRIRWTDGKAAKGGYDVGGTSVRYHTANGVVEIKPSNYVKTGFGFMFAPKLWKRIGATDLTFRLPDRGDEFFLHLPQHAGYELRNYVSHALFTKAPAKSILLKNIKLA